MITITVETPENNGRRIDIKDVIKEMRLLILDSENSDHAEKLLMEAEIQVIEKIGGSDVRVTTLTIESTNRGEGKTVLANEIKAYLEGEGELIVFLEDEVGEREIRLMGARDLTQRKGLISTSDVHIRTVQSGWARRRGRRTF